MLIVVRAKPVHGAINVCKSNKEYGHAVVAVDDDRKAEPDHPRRASQGTLEDIRAITQSLRHPQHHHCHPNLKGSKAEPCHRPVHQHPRSYGCQRPAAGGQRRKHSGVFREPEPADFLSREVTLDTDKISGYLTGKTVLVTGGGSSIGSELCRQVMRFKPGKLLIFDIRKLRLQTADGTAAKCNRDISHGAHQLHPG